MAYNSPQPPTSSLQPGSTGTLVKQLQDYLVAMGFMTQAQVNTGYGTYGPQTTAAVKALQEKMGVDNSSGPGYWGPKTMSAVQTYNNQQGAQTQSQTQPQPQTQPQTQPTGYTNTTPNYQEDYNKPGDTPSSFYGYEEARSGDWEAAGFTRTKGFIETAGKHGIINPSFVSTILSDPSIMAYYINAITYGGYLMGDILNDIKRREMISQGGTQADTLKGVKIIDPEVDKNTYLTTAEGRKSINDTASLIPTFNLQGLMNPDILKYGANMPDEVFKTLVPIFDKNSQEFKDAVDNIKLAYLDLANQQLEAETEQAKAIADYNYQQFKEQLETQYGIALSDDATKAWQQIEELEESFSERGIGQSGLLNEEVDKTLISARKQDQRLREEKLTREEQEMASRYRSSASPSEIQALIEEDKAKGLPRDEWRAVKWGLVPSSDILAKFDMAALRERYPDQSEEELKALRDATLDENGNYRSTLYRNYYTARSSNLQSKKALAESMVLEDATNKELKAYQEYDRSRPFSQSTLPKSETPQQQQQTITQPTTPSTQPTLQQPYAGIDWNMLANTPGVDQNLLKQVQSGAQQTPTTQTQQQPYSGVNWNMLANTPGVDQNLLKQAQSGAQQTTQPTSTTTTTTTRDTSPLKPNESIIDYYKRIGISGY